MLTASTNKFGFYPYIPMILIGLFTPFITSQFRSPDLLVFFVGILCLLLLISNIAAHYHLVGGLDLFSPGILFPAAYIFIVGVGIITMKMGIGYSYLAEVTQEKVNYFLVGFCCYIGGNLIAILLTSHKPKHQLGRVINKWCKRKFFKRILLITLIGSIGASIYYLKLGIPLLGNVDKIRHGFRGRTYGAGFSLQLLEGLNFILIAYLVFYYKHSSKYRVLRWMILILWISLLATLSGYRWLLVSFILFPISAYNYTVQKIKFNFRSIVYASMAVILVITVLALFGYQRKVSKVGGVERYRSNLEAVSISANLSYIAPAFLSLQIPTANFLKLVTLMPNDHAYLSGKYTLAQIPILPRIFPSISKENIGHYITNTIFGLNYRGGSGGTALTIIGGFYIEHGLVAIILGMTLIGYFLEISYLRVIKTPSLLIITIYSFFLWTVIKWIVSGAYLGDLLILLVILLIDKFIRRGPEKGYKSHQIPNEC